MSLDTLQPITPSIAQEQDLGSLLLKIVRGLVDQGGIALARIWVIGPGERSSSGACLKLMASAGNPLNSPDEDWSRRNGEFCRIPLGQGKVGSVGATGHSILVSDVSLDWTTRKDFAEREQIRSFAAHPLLFRGRIFGVLAVFSRIYLEDANFVWLRTFADRVGSAIAQSRPFEEKSSPPRGLAENSYLREEGRSTFDCGEIVGQSAALQNVLEQIAWVAPTEATVLIQGESGTGKELAAQAIHDRSRRRDRPMVRVNCASVPRELFESEFFGHAKGAFTGALRDRQGRFQLAEGGTLFLDEVGEIPLELQPKLLRVLQDGRYERVGDDVTRQAQVRIVAASNRDLRRQVESGRFRQDLYYRLNVFPIEMPPLRSRPEDIPPLTTHLLKQSCRRLRIPEPDLTAVHFDPLLRYDWPGNVRELQNVIERALIMSRNGRLSFEDLVSSGPVQNPVASIALTPTERNMFLTEQEWIRLERANLLAVLRQASGRVGGKGGAAELLGIRPTTLRSRLKAKGIRYDG